MTEIDAKRAQALAWIAEYVPADQGQSAYAEINADWTGGGTTCGFLAHWLLAGCRSAAPCWHRSRSSPPRCPVIHGA